MNIFKQPLFIASTLMLLSACGGGGGDCAPSDGRPLDTSTDTSANCADTRTANTLAIAIGGDGSIEQLDGDSAAVYSRFGSAFVTDQNGDPVPDGTYVQLDVFDTLFARGIIAAGDTISGSLLTDNALIFQGNGTTPTTLTTAVVDRGNDPSLTIKAGDLVLLRNAAKSDRIRYVVSTTANSITVDAPYVNTYPSALYPNADYLVGRALVGTKIHGFDNDSGDKTLGLGQTLNGLANFRFEYPNSILGYGVNAVANDVRFSPLGSTEVWLVANVGGIVGDIERVVFAGIAPLSITVDPPVIDASQNVEVTLIDTNSNTIPFTPISAAADDPANVSATGCTTDAFGDCTSAVNRVASGTITYSGGGGSGDLTVN